MRKASTGNTASKARWGSSQGGFTLLELMIVIVIMSILMVVTVPSMSSFLHANQVSADAGAFYDAVRYAKAQAVESGHAVDLCPTSAATCSSVPVGPAATAPNWAGGFKVQDDVTGAVYRTWPAFHSVTAISSQASTLGTMSNILFNPDQTVVLTSGTAGTGNVAGSFVNYLKLCDGTSASSSGRSVIVNGAGFMSYNLANSNNATSGAAPAAYQMCSCTTSTKVCT